MSMLEVLQHYATEVTAKYALPIECNPEDQLKGPMVALLRAIGKELGLAVEVVTEVQAEKLGRPDLGVAVGGLLAGHVELKAPGKGAKPDRYKGADKKQWERFKNLPNLVYTDGNEWALYRSGEKAGRVVRFAGDAATEGPGAISQADSEALQTLMHDFLRWRPIVPASPRALAKMLAPLCRLLREDVLNAVQNQESNLYMLAGDWRRYLFPDADDGQFADAYAQTMTYALLLARLSREGEGLSIPQAVDTIRTGHRLLADTLNILGDPKAREEIETPVRVLERVIGAVDPAALRRKAKGDPWLYFYEDFLAAYDPKMRKERGVYYTPVEVVQTQVRLVAEILEKALEKDYAFVNPDVVTLDPGAGTGTYILAALQHGLQQVEKDKGPGMRASFATQAAKNIYAFEILVGPYTVAHLRLSQEILAEGGQMPTEGVHVYLTDTLESPYQPPPERAMMYKELAKEHKRAQQVKATVPVLVCMGNPPYDRQQIELEEQSQVRRKGGWVRFGGEEQEGAAIFKDFLTPLEPLGWGVHAKNLYNDYVYFWRWALWKVFESKDGPGLVSFITAASYLRGPGFAGMRQVMRQTFDEMWIIDLEGDNLGARKTENVFAIQTPVAIAMGVRYGKSQPERPAAVHYTRISGTQEEKLKTLDQVRSLRDLPWRECLVGWTERFLPTSDKPYWNWPLMTEIFPWQANGVEFQRTWPIAETPEVLMNRWNALLSAPKETRNVLLRETVARNAQKAFRHPINGRKLTQISELKPGEPAEEPIRCAFRSFDREWAFLDIRLCDRPRPTLLKAHGRLQIYITSLLTEVLGEGPAAVATAELPEKHHFRGSFGGAHVIPLWRDAEATEANLTAGVVEVLGQTYGRAVTPEDLFAYAYAVLATPEYVRRFWDELTIPGPRLPITKDAARFARAVELGRTLLWLHTYGERWVPEGQKRGKIPPGPTKCRKGTPAGPEKYPEGFSYDAAKEELHVGEGVFGPVRQEVWEFSVSGFKVVQSWLAYRMKQGAGKKSSPLDKIRPESWQFDEELLDLLWVLEHTVEMWPELAGNLEEILAGELFEARDFPQPTEMERAAKKHTPLFEQGEE